MPDPKSSTPAPETSAGAADRAGESNKANDKKNRNRPEINFIDSKDELAKLAKRLEREAARKTILVPVDFSPHSEAALEFANDMAEKLPGHLLILHVVHDPGEMPGYYAKLVKKKRVGRIQDIAREVFDDFLKQFIEQHQHVRPVRHADNLMLMGLPVTRILQVIEKLQPAMVVMGSQGRTGLKHLLLGSKAEQVVQLSAAPVTIVKRKNPS